MKDRYVLSLFLPPKWREENDHFRFVRPLCNLPQITNNLVHQYSTISYLERSLLFNVRLGKKWTLSTIDSNRVSLKVSPWFNYHVSFCYICLLLNTQYFFICSKNEMLLVKMLQDQCGVSKELTDKQKWHVFQNSNQSQIFLLSCLNMNKCVYM